VEPGIKTSGGPFAHIVLTATLKAHAAFSIPPARHRQNCLNTKDDFSGATPTLAKDRVYPLRFFGLSDLSTSSDCNTKVQKYFVYIVCLEIFSGEFQLQKSTDFDFLPKSTCLYMGFTLTDFAYGFCHISTISLSDSR
jgi:hypothetical protein